MDLSWILLSVRCTNNNIQHCDGFGMASAQCQMYKKTTYNTVMALSWLLLSVRCTKKQYTTLWWLWRGFCSVSDVQKINIQHCDGFVVASAQCQMYKKTTYNTVMALSWLLLSVRCTKKQHTTLWWLCHGLSSAQCQMYKQQYTTLWWLCWLCHGFCSVSDVQKNNIQHGFAMASALCQMYNNNNIQHCDGFVMAVPDVQKNNICNGFGMASAQCQMYKKTIYTTDGFVVASAQCQMYKKTTYNTVMALSWLLLSVRCTKKQHTTLWWLCHGFCSVSDVQKNNIQHCDGFVVASAQCQMYKKSTYNTVMALSWLLLSVRCTKKQYTTLWWLCHGFCSVSDVQKNNIQHCDGFVMAFLLSDRCTKKQYSNTVMDLSWLLLTDV